MEGIVGDRYLTLCREFIQNNIEKEWLSLEIKDKFVDYYGKLNPENAKEYYEMLTKGYQDTWRQ